MNNRLGRLTAVALLLAGCETLVGADFDVSSRVREPADASSDARSEDAVTPDDGGLEASPDGPDQWPAAAPCEQRPEPGCSCGGYSCLPGAGCWEGACVAAAPPLLDYRFDAKVVDGVVWDGAAFGRHGDVRDDVAFVEAFGGRAAQFDGQFDAVELDAAADLFRGNFQEFTWLLRLRTDEYPPSGETDVLVMMGEPGGSIAQRRVEVRLDESGRVGLLFERLESAWSHVFPQPVPTGEWVELAIVADASGLRVGQDGVFSASVPFDRPHTLSNRLALGGPPLPETEEINRGFHGAIDSFRVFASALDAQQLAIQRTAASGGAPAADPIDSCPFVDEDPADVRRYVPPPMAYYSFDEQDIVFRTALDASGSDLHGAIWGAIRPTCGVAGEALDFEDTAVLLSPDVFNLGSRFSVAAWVRTRSDGSRHIFSKRQPNRPGFRLMTSGYSGGVDFATFRSGDIPKREAAAFDFIADGSWHHVVAVHDRQNLFDTSVAIYIDGRLAANRAPNHSGLEGVFANDWHAAIGASGGDPDDPVQFPTHDSFAGKLDEVAVWSQALTASQVEAVYLTGRSGWRLVGSGD